MNNEPAFPVGVDVTQNQWKPSSGMSLRDYFAAKVINGHYLYAVHMNQQLQ